MKSSLLFIFSIALSVNALAFDYGQPAKSFKKRIKGRSAGFLSEQTHKLLTRSQEDISAGNVEGGMKLLRKLEERTKKKAGEQAQVLQVIGYALLQQDKQDEALTKFEKALDLDALPEAPSLSVLYIASQIHALKERHKTAEKAIKLWLACAQNPNGQAYAALASVLMAQKKQSEALEAIQKAIDIAPRPKEAWLATAVSLYFELKKYDKAARVLKVLVAQNPKKETYWKQWAASHLNANEEKESLVAMELASQMGHVKDDSSVKNMSSLMMSTDIPYKAAITLEKKLSKAERGKLKNKKMLASAWALARENKKAIGVLWDIHKNNPDLKTSLQLGQLLIEEEKWKDAVSVFSKAKGLKPDSDQKEQIFIGLGVAIFNQGDFQKARENFVKVADTSDIARTWLNFVQSQSDTPTSL